MIEECVRCSNKTNSHSYLCDECFKKESERKVLTKYIWNHPKYYSKYSDFNNISDEVKTFNGQHD